MGLTKGELQVLEELLLNGTPSQIAAVLNELGYPTWKLPDDERYHVGSSDMSVKEDAYIRIVPAPEGSRLTAYVRYTIHEEGVALADGTIDSYITDYYIEEEIEDLWLTLRAELQRLGWAANSSPDQSPSSSPAATPSKKPIMTCNQWLITMVLDKGFSAGANTDDNEMFQLWLKLHEFERRLAPSGAKELSDPWKSYQKAISDERNRRNK